MTSLLLVGGGHMGSAFLRRLPQGVKATVIDPAPKRADLPASVEWLNAPEKIDPGLKPDIVILAVKPQHADDALPAYKRFNKSVFLSIMAGTPLAKMAGLLGDDRAANYAIVRTMPNMPASIGQGITVAIANGNVGPAQKILCEKFIESLGQVLWVENETLLNAVTALSGSGPAYVFALTEAMAKAGKKLGLPPAVADQLARQTVTGSGALLAQSPETPEALRVSVTSPKGTTEAALKHLLAAGGLDDLLLRAMQTAAERAEELAR